MKLDNSDIQANILKGHGRDHAYFIFCHFSCDKKPEEIRSLIIDLSTNLVTSHETQCLDSETYNIICKAKNQTEIKKELSLYEYEAAAKKVVISLYLTNKGYQKMRILPEYTPSERSFRNGMMYGTHSSERLGDYQLIDTESVFNEEGGFDCLVLVANSNEEELKSKKKELFEVYLNKIIKYEHGSPFIQYAKVLRDENNKPKEHFGYSEGFSTPKDEKTLAEIGLTEECGRKNTYGSYVAFRKIEQNVCYFHKKLLKKLKSKLGIENHKHAQKYAMALLMGRFPNGTPLAMYNQEQPEWNEEMEGKFVDYSNDVDGHRCPVHAHIRAVNRRVKDEPNPQIIRRSVTYEDGPVNKGLCFLSYQSSIENNFLPLFNNMGVPKKNQEEKSEKKIGDNMEERPEKKKRVLDAITYRPRNEFNTPCTDTSESSQCLTYLKKYNRLSAGTVTLKIPGRKLTTFRGGAYFFAPSLSFLKNLHDFAVPGDSYFKPDETC